LHATIEFSFWFLFASQSWSKTQKKAIKMQMMKMQRSDSTNLKTKNEHLPNWQMGWRNDERKTQRAKHNKNQRQDSAKPVCI
jgi:hypothetical protein